MNPFTPLLLLIALFAFSESAARAQDDDTKRKLREAGAISKVYKTTQDSDGNPVTLKAHVFNPPGH
jgi:hypothetical protein